MSQSYRGFNMGPIKRLNKRYFMTAIVAGVLGTIGIFFSFQVAMGTTSINFTWSIIFPLLITLSYGKLYGLFSITFGFMFLYPFIMGPSNGWASLVPMFSLYVFIFLHGYGYEKRSKHKQWFNHPVTIQLGYSVIRFILYILLFQSLVQLNPPFWQEEALTSISSSWVMIFLIRGLVMEWLLLAIAFVCLHLPVVKKILGLTIKKSERYNTRIVMSIVGFGLLFMTVFIQIQVNLFHDDPIDLYLYRFTTEVRFLLFFSGVLFIILSGVTIYFLERHLESENRLVVTALRYQSLFESMDDLYFECDAEGIILDVSPSVVSTLKCKKTEVIGQCFFTYVNKNDERENWLQAIQNNQTIKDESIEINTHKGDTRYWSMHLKQVDLSEHERRLVSIIRDFTDYQYALNHIQQLNQTLEKKVDERTSSLQATLEALERFVHVVSHDLKTPARAISAYAEILIEDEKEALNKASLSYLRQVQSISDDMIQLIESVLSYAMLGNKEADAEWFMPQSIIETVMSRFERVYPETKCTVEFVGKLNDIYADRILFQQALTNIIENAYKYKKPDYPLELIISSDLVHAGTIIIEDNGIGIDPEENLVLFDLFRTVNNDSSGIGLATVKKIMEMHKGNVRMDGKQGEGVKMTLLFKTPAQRKEVK